MNSSSCRRKSKTYWRNKSWTLFRKLLKDHADSYDQERRANLLATEAQLQATVAQPAAKHLETYEQHYNAACRLIEAKEYTNALKELTAAESKSLN